MTKKAKISFLILVWSIVAIQMYINYQERVENQQQIITAFSVINNGSMKESVRGYGYFGSMELSDQIKRKMLENLACKLGITDGYEFSGNENNGSDTVTLTKDGQYAATTLQMISITGAEGSCEQYILMEIKMKENLENAVSLYQKVKRLYKEIGVDGQVSMEAEMERPGDWITENKDQIIEEIFDKIHARKRGSIKKDGMDTVYGYTRLEDEYLILNKKKVNIQIAFSYDEEQDKTLIKIGLPIVNSSY